MRRKTPIHRQMVANLQSHGLAHGADALRILAVAPFAPRLDGRHGGSRAIAQFLAHLSRRHEVGLLVVHETGEPSVDGRLRSACAFVEEVELPTVGGSFRAKVANRLRLRAALVRGMPTWAAERAAPGFADRLEAIARSWQPDVVQFEFRIMGQFLPILDGGSAIRLLVDHDPAAPEARLSSRWVEPLEALAWRSLARTVSKHADAVVVFTERDQAAVESVTDSTPVEAIALGYDLPPRPLDPVGANGRGVVFIGSFIHPPNVDAAEHLTRRLFPLIRAQVPDAALTLVGSYPSDRVRALAGDGVSLAADVPDVAPFLEEAAVVVAPIRLGGGMRVKVLEALASGKAVVASSAAVEGLDVVHGRDLLVADTDDAFADAVSALLLDPARRAAVARAARQWALRTLAVDAKVRRYEELYDRLRATRDEPESLLSLTA